MTKFALAIGLFAALTVSIGARAQTVPKDFVGTWKVEELLTENDAPLLGQRPNGVAILSTDGRFTVMIVRRDAKAATSVEDKATLYDSLRAYAGRYTVTPDKNGATGKITFSVEIASDPSWIGKARNHIYKFMGSRNHVSIVIDNGKERPGENMVLLRQR